MIECPRASSYIYRRKKYGIRKEYGEKQQAKKANSKNRKFSSFTIVYHVSRTHRMSYIWPSLNATKNTLYVNGMRLHANVPFCYSVHLINMEEKKIEKRPKSNSKTYRPNSLDKHSVLKC